VLRDGYTRFRNTLGQCKGRLLQPIAGRQLQSANAGRYPAGIGIGSISDLPDTKGMFPELPLKNALTESLPKSTLGICFQLSLQGKGAQ